MTCLFTLTNALFTAFSSCESTQRSWTHHADEEIIWQSAPRIRVIAWTPRRHFKILFNTIRRAASASWSGLIWQQGISLHCQCALSTCLCLSVVLILKSFVSRLVTDTHKTHHIMGLFCTFKTGPSSHYKVKSFIILGHCYASRITD